MKKLFAFIIAPTLIGTFVSVAVHSAYGAPPDDSTVIQLPARIFEVLSTVHGGFLWCAITVGILIEVATVSIAVRYGYNKGKAESNSYWGS